MNHQLPEKPSVFVLARLACALVVSLAFIGCGSIRSKAESSNSPITFTPSAATATAPAAGAMQNSYADVVARVAPAVVTVRSERRGRAAQQHPFMDDPTFREFFGDRLPRGPQTPRREEGLGSGVIVTADGYILTNHHVVDGADEVKIEMNDRRVMDAKVVGSDQPSDLAVLKVNATNLPVLPLGNSDQVRVGDLALAVGNPLGIGQTVTSGIISAKNRATGLGDGSFADFIQTDAPINRGNSGGALVNTNGELIGINSQILSPSGGSIGIGFAIPSNMAKGVMEQLVKGGKVRRGQLGVQIQDVTSDIAASLDLKEIRGVIIGAVTPGSAGERAGLKQGDVITALNNAPVNDVNGLRNRVASTAPGTDVTLTIIRDGREQQMKATLGEFDQTAQRGAGEDNSGNGNGAGSSEATGKLGIRVQPLTPELAGELQLQSGAQGVVVAEVDPNGPAADAGLQRGDVIVQINRQPIRSTADLTAAISRSATRPALLLINRRGTTVFLTVKPKA